MHFSEGEHTGARRSSIYKAVCMGQLMRRSACRERFVRENRLAPSPSPAAPQRLPQLGCCQQGHGSLPAILLTHPDAAGCTEHTHNMCVHILSATDICGSGMSKAQHPSSLLHSGWQFSLSPLLYGLPRLKPGFHLYSHYLLLSIMY